MTEPDLVGAVTRLVDQVTHWTPAGWAVSSAAGPRAEIMHALAQRLADLEATVAGRSARPVPRLDNDLALPDQVRVTARDLLAAAPEPETLAEATQAVNDTRQALAEPRA